jgi:tRNA(adenine34) deaminase
MAERPVNTKAELLAGMQTSWDRLNLALDRLSAHQLAGVRDAQGWAVKDHLVHLAVWERSNLSFLRGQPRRTGLGVEREVYQRGDFDEINAVIFQQHKDLPLAEALALFREVHRQMLRALEPLSDADLLKAYGEYLPEESGDARLAIDVVCANTTDHYDEHLEWIEALARIGEQDAHFMDLALKQAELAISKGQEPFGAVVLDQHGRLIGAGHNTVRADLDPSAHGEIVAIRDACRREGGLEALEGATLYTSCEPCLLCTSVITYHGIRRVVYAALGADVPGYKPLLDHTLVSTAAWVNANLDRQPLEVAGPLMRERAVEQFARFEW